VSRVGQNCVRTLHMKVETPSLPQLPPSSPAYTAFLANFTRFATSICDGAGSCSWNERNSPFLFNVRVVLLSFSMSESFSFPFQCQSRSPFHINVRVVLLSISMSESFLSISMSESFYFPSQCQSRTCQIGITQEGNVANWVQERANCRHDVLSQLLCPFPNNLQAT